MNFTWPMLLSCKWFVYICNIHKWWNRTLGHSNASWHCDVDSSGLNAVPYGWHISYINSNKLFINNIVESRKHWKSFLLIKYSTISSLKVLVRLNGSIKWKSYDTFINKINKNSGGGGKRWGASWAGHQSIADKTHTCASTLDSSANLQSTSLDWGRKLLQQQGGHANCTQKGPTQPGGSHGDRRDDSVNHTIIRLLHN